jgi:hypothetical protein
VIGEKYPTSNIARSSAGSVRTVLRVGVRGLPTGLSATWFAADGYDYAALLSPLV